MDSAQATYILETVFLPALQNEHGATKKVIEAIPLDKGDYRPDPIAMTAMDLAWHIAMAEMRFVEAVINGQFDFTGTRPESIRNSADVSRWYADTFAANLQRLKATPGEQLAKVIDFRGMLQLPAVLFLRLGVSHSIHHRGQLSTYLRPMGAKVPSIYGESYDAAQARKAAQA
jgi:uncharacterized damage-inducible protein DinB